MLKKTLILITIAILFLGCSQSELKESLGSAKVEKVKDRLTISTGKIERSWKITPFGLLTTEINNLETGKKWVNTSSENCDWAYYGLIDGDTECKLISFNAIQSSDSGFTSNHLLVTAEFEYPSVETFINYEVRVYPNADGIFTRFGIKGNPSKYIEHKNNNAGATFSLVSGKEKYDYKAHGFSKDYMANYTLDAQKIEYLIAGLDKEKKYNIGLSWWDFNGQNINQKVSVTSVDGENSQMVVKPRKVPDYTHNNQMPEEIEFELPQKVLLDGSFRLIIENTGGSSVTLSEIWIKEKSDNDIYIAGNIDRVNNLRNNLPPGRSLFGYLNCGEANNVEASTISGRVDFVPVNATLLTRRYIGYYNDTQHRNTPETPLIKEEKVTTEVSGKENNSWASILCIEDNSDALILVKESHKCVNQYGYDTGDFELTENGVSNTGTSLAPHEILPDTYRYSWATWLIVGKNSPVEMELALKQFDRIRYPIDPNRDIYIQANTWGSGRGREAANEENVLKEIASQADLGIDIQQIDDGWQAKQGWKPKKEWYPQAWETVKQKTIDSNLKLGLWAAAMPITLEQLKWNFDNGGFVSYKLDFARLNNHEEIENMIQKIRQFVLYTNHSVRVNWDVTENAPRYGYFWARDYGCVFLENRKPNNPENVVYVPYLVLRDLWHLSKYCNLNKFQGTVQNIDRVNKEISDAYLHNHAYVTAIPLMSTPLFFQETQFYSKEAREQIKPVLAAYKEHRKELYESFVYPIGEEPNNASWSGFQAHHPSKNIGFINLFRELNNKETNKKIRLKFLKNADITFTNLMSKDTFSTKADSEGYVEFAIENSCEFRMYKYEY